MLFSRFLKPAPAAVFKEPSPMARDFRAGHLRAAEWHLRAAVWEDAAGDAEQADYHRQAAREFIEAATGRRLRARTVEEIRFELQKELEQ